MVETGRDYYDNKLSAFPTIDGSVLTVPVVMQVEQLVAPLCQDPQRILEESDHDQEPAKSWEVSAMGHMSAPCSVFIPRNPHKAQRRVTRTASCGVVTDVRLDRFAIGVQKILDLGRLLSNLVERAWVGADVSLRTAK